MQTLTFGSNLSATGVAAGATFFLLFFLNTRPATGKILTQEEV